MRVGGPPAGRVAALAGLLAAGLLAAPPAERACAQEEPRFFRWVDESGDTHIVDSRDKVPPGYRVGAEEITTADLAGKDADGLGGRARTEPAGPSLPRVPVVPEQAAEEARGWLARLWEAARELVGALLASDGAPEGTSSPGQGIPGEGIVGEGDDASLTTALPAEVAPAGPGPSPGARSPAGDGPGRDAVPEIVAGEGEDLAADAGPTVAVGVVPGPRPRTRGAVGLVLVAALAFGARAGSSLWARHQARTLAEAGELYDELRATGPGAGWDWARAVRLEDALLRARGWVRGADVGPTTVRTHLEVTTGGFVESGALDVLDQALHHPEQIGDQARWLLRKAEGLYRSRARVPWTPGGLIETFLYAPRFLVRPATEHPEHPGVRLLVVGWWVALVLAFGA